MAKRSKPEQQQQHVSILNGREPMPYVPLEPLSLGSLPVYWELRVLTTVYSSIGNTFSQPMYSTYVLDSALTPSERLFLHVFTSSRENGPDKGFMGDHTGDIYGTADIDEHEKMAREILAKAHELEDLHEVEQESNRVKFPHIVVGHVWFQINTFVN